MSRQVIPISFSIPECKILDTKVEDKDTLMASVIPGNYDTYLKTEEEMYDHYKRCFFGLTYKKAGWDCMRHYEILAAGCIPVFTDLHKAPPRTMTHLPKNLLMEARNLYEEMKVGVNDDNFARYKILHNQLTFYTRQFLTTRKMAEYVLYMANATGAKKILYLSGDLYSDYLRCLTLIGFKEIMGQNCHDYPKVGHIYKNHNVPESQMYGRGFTYQCILDQNLHNDEADATVEDDIRSQKYDIIIYGSYTRGMPYYDLVSKSYPADKVILFCGEDSSRDFKPYINNGHYYFLREIY